MLDRTDTVRIFREHFERYFEIDIHLCCLSRISYSYFTYHGER